MEEKDDLTIYRVVVNHEEQYSITLKCAAWLMWMFPR